jgi:hypothetical protein
LQQSNPFSPTISTGLIPIIKTNIKFIEEGIDAKFNLLDATPIERKNLNKLRQILSIFHNFTSMNIDNPRIKKSLTEISRVKQLTEGINSNEWIQDQLMNTSQSYQSFEDINLGSKHTRLGRMVSIPYNFTSQQSQIVPYIIFRYLTTQISNDSLAVYYELNADEPEDTSPYKVTKVTKPKQLKATQAIIKIITSRYVFNIIANEVLDPNDTKYSTTAGMVDIIEVRGNRETICSFVTHPLEIIKTAAIKTNNWSVELQSNNNQDINREEECREFDKWFNSLPRGKTVDLMILCNESDEGNREGIRISINSYGHRAIRVLKALYEYNINNPCSFKTTNNCIGFRWEIEQLEKDETKEVRDKDNDQVKIKTYNLIIDRDFNYIYVYRQEHW